MATKELLSDKLIHVSKRGTGVKAKWTLRLRDTGVFNCTWYARQMYRKTYNISRTLVGSKIVDNSGVVGASLVGAAPTTSSFST